MRKYKRFVCFLLVVLLLHVEAPINTAGAYTLNKAVVNEIKGMTYYKPDKEVHIEQYAMSFKLAVKEYIKKWSKKWKSYKKMIETADVYELLARTFYYESSQNNKSRSERENEILAFDTVIKNRLNHYYTKELYGGPSLYGVLTKEHQFSGLTKNPMSYKAIKYNKKKMDLTLVRSVIVALSKKIGASKLKYPDNMSYCYWHSIEDWKEYTNNDETKIRFPNSNIYRIITMKKRYSDTWFYDYQR